MNISFTDNTTVKQSGLFNDFTNKRAHHLDAGHSVKVIGEVKYPRSKQADILVKTTINGSEQKMWIPENLLN